MTEVPQSTSLQGSCPMPFTLPSKIWDRTWGEGSQVGSGCWDPVTDFTPPDIRPQADFPIPPLPHAGCGDWASGFAALCLSFPTCKPGLWVGTTSRCSPGACCDLVCRVTAGGCGGSQQTQPLPHCRVSPPSQPPAPTPHSPLPWLPSGDRHMTLRGRGMEQGELTTEPEAALNNIA